MPGYILHLAAARMYLDRLPADDLLCTDLSAQNDFFAGSLLPDTVTDKRTSHFRLEEYGNRMMIWPHLDMFRSKYRNIMDTPVCRGYYFHLYIDKKFFQEYIPQVAEFYDRTGKITEVKREIVSVRLKKTGEVIPPERYLSEEYYYGDYTKMNTWICQKYSLPEHLDPPANPGIEEVNFQDIEKVMEQLKGYRNVSEDAVNDLRVFDLESLLEFLEKAAAEFAVTEK